MLEENLSRHHTTLEPSITQRLIEIEITKPGGYYSFPLPDNSSYPPGLQILTGYPSPPLYNRLCESLKYWASTG